MFFFEFTIFVPLHAYYSILFHVWTMLSLNFVFIYFCLFTGFERSGAVLSVSVPYVITPFTVAPSKLTADDIHSKKVDGILCARSEILFGFLDLNLRICDTDIPPDIALCATMVLSVNSLFQPGCEEDHSAFMSAMFQKTEKNDSVMWFHQVNRDLIGQMDIVAMKKIDGVFCLRVIIEMSIANVTKSNPLFGYVNNCFASDFWYQCADVLLGVVIVMGGTICLSAYYKVVDGDSGKVAEVKLFEEAYNTTNLGKVLFFIAKWNLIDHKYDPRAKPVSSKRRNVLLCGDTVYKVFDYRDRGHVEGKRMLEANMKFLPGAELVYKSLDVNILSYPFIPGSHSPSISAQLRAVLRSVIRLHEAEYVHGDIRASNIVFCPSSGLGCSSKRSQLIDFDYCGEEGKARYPPFFNPVISDGKRHDEASSGALLRKEHDYFALASVFSQFQPRRKRKAYLAVCKSINEGCLFHALKALQKHFDFDIPDGAIVPVEL